MSPPTVCDMQFYFQKGVIKLEPGGGIKANVCHELWLDYWVSCRMPAKPFIGPWSDEQFATFWKVCGLLLQGKLCPCIPDCQGKDCGNDGCGGSCGECGKIGQHATFCNGGKCEKIPCDTDSPEPFSCCNGDVAYYCWSDGFLAADDCAIVSPGSTCGWNKSSNKYKCNNSPEIEPSGKVPKQCPWNCHVPCEEEADCPDGYDCDGEGKCAPDCDAVCDGLQCGDGETCGICNCGEPCPFGWKCDAGACVKVCASDDCSGFCWDCPPGAGWACEIDGCNCSPCCDGKECGEDGCGGTCGSCAPGSTCRIDGKCAVSDESGTKAEYQGLMATLDLEAILQLSTSESESIIEMCWQIESGSTGAWGEFDDAGVSYLTEQQAMKIWMRRVATGLFAERSALFPWSLADSSSEALLTLFGYGVRPPFGIDQNTVLSPKQWGATNFEYASLGDGTFSVVMPLIWDSNPLEGLRFALHLQCAYSPESQMEAWNALWDYLTRKRGFTHTAAGSESYDESVPGHILPSGIKSVNLAVRLEQAPITGCPSMGRLLVSLLRSLNLPSSVSPITDVDGSAGQGHVGVLLRLTAGDYVLLDSDWVYTGVVRWASGEDVLATYTELLNWANDGICTVYWAGHGEAVKKLLMSADKEDTGSALFELYCEYLTFGDQSSLWGALFEPVTIIGSGSDGLPTVVACGATIGYPGVSAQFAELEKAWEGSC